MYICYQTHICKQSEDRCDGSDGPHVGSMNTLHETMAPSHCSEYQPDGHLPSLKSRISLSDFFFLVLKLAKGILDLRFLLLPPNLS